LLFSDLKKLTVRGDRLPSKNDSSTEAIAIPFPIPSEEELLDRHSPES